MGEGRLLVATDRVTTADGIAAARARRFDVRGGPRRAAAITPRSGSSPAAGNMRH
ncbi:hypothetical protein DVS28_a4352 [Euzebya pacifica]|uniref:Uncharacterized protein n=1 Tax=Euzebya pacifica TaxID=1608957 RepID=A0A346Y3H1_9ACTN|nr:hypothetical protein DVS28_a4352 [Euzebya pacifica]